MQRYIKILVPCITKYQKFENIFLFPVSWLEKEPKTGLKRG
jgi:hypothetical protein